MGRIIAVIILFITLIVCAILWEKRHQTEAPSFQHVSVDTSKVKNTKQVYVPVNWQSKTKSGAMATKTILKIRNTSFSDSIYVSRIGYYDIQGVLLKDFIDSALLVRPMTTTEITVKDNAFKTRGDNFIVQWHSADSLQKPLIQAISLDAQNKVLATEQGVIITNRSKGSH